MAAARTFALGANSLDTGPKNAQSKTLYHVRKIKSKSIWAQAKVVVAIVSSQTAKATASALGQLTSKRLNLHVINAITQVTMLATVPTLTVWLPSEPDVSKVKSVLI